MRKKRYLKKWVENTLIIIVFIINILVCNINESININTFIIITIIDFIISILILYILINYGRLFLED